MTMLPNGRKAARPATKAALTRSIPKPEGATPAMTATLSEALGFKGARDMAYQFATHTDGEGKFVAWFRAAYPAATSKEKIPDEFVTEFTAGCYQRHGELQAAVTYVREGEDSYRPKADGETIPDGKALHLSVAYCTEMSTHEFGKLLPNLKRLVKGVRDKAKNYRDVKFGRFVKALFADAESGPRAANKTFAEWFDKMLVDAIAKAKRATEKGDATAPNPDALRVKIEAFKAALKA